MNDDEALELLRKLFVQLMDAQRSGATRIEIERADGFNAVGLAFKYMEVVEFAKHGMMPSLEVGGVALVRAQPPETGES